jgi:uncharacterized membrane-anchored protein
MLCLLLLILAILPEIITVIVFLGTINATGDAFISIIIGGITYALMYYLVRKD